ncbi:MAG: carbamoyltransferase HypF [Candidatus Lokiarchaeota archaeon]|nr:carbamoyltransferase HypF [Candidatus Lokiarchaeota archaeon]
MSRITQEFTITGIVQGVGFRPFLFDVASSLGLKGYILNQGNAGVRLVLQGETEALNQFSKDLELKKPPISYIESVLVNNANDDTVFQGLEIRKSEQGRGKGLTLPPDIATCDECLEDMRNSKIKKYWNYPFIACAHCGPRFTTVTSLPYDRERTTMSQFPLCVEGLPSCVQEYENVKNRRFHAQTFACKICGPQYFLCDENYNIVPTKSFRDILNIVAKRVERGDIGAVKGIGGVHLACRADNDETILRLRKAKGKRKNKPFAVMVPNLSIIEDFFNLTQTEKTLLESFRRPITLLERKEGQDNDFLSKQVAPGLTNVGFVLPYSGIHHLLFDYIGEKPLIYTSGNPSNVPMSLNNEKIFEQLGSLADFFLLHDRPIYQRADDSVIRVHGNVSKIIRRARGYVPEYLPLPFKVDLPAAIATGPELATTGAILRGNRIFPTQHIGNVTHLETFNFLKDAVFHIKSLLQIKDSEVEFIACDTHPEFITSKYAKELASQFKIPIYPIQHHFAHALGLMAENGIQPEESVVVISTDGVGYGLDGNIWGGEILACSYDGYDRVGHLKYQPMIGADRCTKYPARMVASMLLYELGNKEGEEVLRRLNLENDLEYGETELKTLITQFNKAEGRFPTGLIPLTSSTGRVLDAISYVLGACKIKTYRGEPAMRLEGLASRGNPESVKLNVRSFEKDGMIIIDTSRLLLDVLRLVQEGNNKKDIAAKAQIELGREFANIAVNEANKRSVKKIGLTGGVAYNNSISMSVKNHVLKENLVFIEHQLVPPGDAGISTGQLVGALFKYLSSN